MAELGAAAGAAAGADAGAAAGGDAAAGAGGGCYCPENLAEERESKLAIDVFEKLKDLQCPLMRGLHIKQPETVKQLLCTPSKYRMDILQWMYTRACPSSAPVLNPASRTPEEAKIQVMLSVSRELMLIGPVTSDILLGRGGTLEQLRVMEELLDAVRSMASKMEELIQKYKLFSVSLKKRLEEGFDLEVIL
uniref:HAUS augmin like complex subunit 7 n=1 Tax=Pipistrellus kuhlii TaxID=59472 RepID=A0A7J7R478_PIPKU|nr:HAUS augmin like complex subunit 7 [Pipistrellus kuhlii]